MRSSERRTQFRRHVNFDQYEHRLSTAPDSIGRDRRTRGARHFL